MKNTNFLSVIVPCFNEQETIGQLLKSVLRQKSVLEIIVIDDGSRDGSIPVIQSIKSSKIKLIENPKNFGKGYCVNLGLAKAKGKYVLIQDADLEYNPIEYTKLIEPLENGTADVVFGSRFLTSTSRRALYYRHKLGNNLLTILSNLFTNIDLTDMETCYKVMKKDVAHSLEIQEKRFGIEPEITAKIAAMKVKIFEVPISYNGRTYEEGKKITWKDGLSALRCIVKYNSRRTKKNQYQKYIKTRNTTKNE